MALSFCSTWGSSVINPATAPEFTTGDRHHIFTATELCAANFYCHTDHIVFDSQFLDQAGYDYDHQNHLHNPIDSSYHYLKRRKSFEDCYPNVNVPCFVSGFNVLGSIPAAPTPEFLPFAPFPEFQPNGEEGVKKSRTVSAQSVAARQRRRRITEKTQELGKLVPGGTKMNTAEMFHAASNYVKWLQAQVSILQCIKETEKPMELNVLLASSMIQEKLYSEGKCLVPNKFVQKLADDLDIQSKPWIVKDINLLLPPQTKD